MNLVEATEAKVIYVASNIRRDDEIEVWLSHHVDGPTAVLDSWHQSRLAAVIETEDGLPVGVTGVVGDRIWMLGTSELTATTERRLHLCKKGRGWVQHCLETVGAPIGNYVYAKNRRSIRWLRFLGFEVGTPQPYGPSAALFRPFWKVI